MLVLGIETSCDETSAAVVRNGSVVLSCVIASSKNDFLATGGVIPEDAARKQLESILPVLTLALEQANTGPADLDAIAVTYGPGLLGSLLVGTSAARVLSGVWKKPLLPVHHTLGHLSSTWLIPPPLTPPPAGEGKIKKDSLPPAGEGLGMGEKDPAFPILTLSVSGGHSDLWYRTSHAKGQLASTTRDDAAGEAFDKGAVLLGLPYPGGPALAKLAQGGDETAFDFPRPLHGQDTTDFSFSGLKTSLKYLIRDLGKQADNESARKNIAASYQFAICRHLCDGLKRAFERFPDTKEIHLVGGVSANERLRAMVENLESGLMVRWPAKLQYCTDNAAMIAAAAYHQNKKPISKTFTTLATASLQKELS